MGVRSTCLRENRVHFMMTASLLLSSPFLSCNTGLENVFGKCVVCCVLCCGHTTTACLVMMKMTIIIIIIIILKRASYELFHTNSLALCSLYGISLYFIGAPSQRRVPSAHCPWSKYTKQYLNRNICT